MAVIAVAEQRFDRPPPGAVIDLDVADVGERRSPDSLASCASIG
jgi:hypothetical protein